MEAEESIDARPEQVERLERIAELWREYCESRSVRSRNQLATIYYPLVRNIARMMQRSLAGRGDLGDLESYGAEGLIGAIERFDPDKGYEFSAFAAYRIRYSILDGVRSADWVPRSVRDHERRFREVEEEHFARVGRAPDAAEAAAELGVSVDELHRLRGLTSRTVVSSISGAIDSDGERYGSEPAAKDADPLGEVVSGEVIELVREGIRRLPDRQRTVLVMSIDRGATLAEIGKELGVTESRACQIRSKGIAQLRSYLADAGVRSA